MHNKAAEQAGRQTDTAAVVRQERLSKHRRRRANLYVGIDSGCINDGPAGDSIGIHDRHGHEAVDEGAGICLLQKHTNG